MKKIKKIRGAGLHAKLKTVWRRSGGKSSRLEIKTDALEIENKGASAKHGKATGAKIEALKGGKTK